MSSSLFYDSVSAEVKLRERQEKDLANDLSKQLAQIKMLSEQEASWKAKVIH
jgi:hypothetical protein